MLVLYRIDPGTVFPRHTHPHAQYGTLLEGAATFHVGDRSWQLRPGDAYYVPPEVPHELLTDASMSSVILDVFAPERQDFLNEALAPDEP